MAMTVFIYEPDQELQVHENVSSLPEYNTEATLWIDIESDTTDEISTIASALNLHELSTEDCLAPGHFPKIDDYGGYLFMIFRALKSWSEVEEIWEQEEDIPPEGEDDFQDHFTRKVAVYLSKNFIVTFRRGEVAWVDALLRQAQQYPEHFFAESTDVIAHRVIDVLIDRFTRGMNYFDDLIDDFEDAAIKDPESFEVADLLELKHTLSILNQIMRSQRNVITRLAHDVSFIKERQRRRYFKDVDDHALAILGLLEKLTDNCIGIRDSYLALANVRLGDTMRVLTVITTIVAPLNIVVGLYGMNFEAIPLLHNPHGFWFIVVVMVLLGVVMLAYFRRKHWI